ncbi:DsbC family protein [Sphingomonas sp. ID1715]|uniref:DsbC family protein n=1 Tax=Sphingomonas sp. ID1715 TaxID=1656898 RepID=UPI001488486C|nr:DsbC family protein [Sphingomonas sp. ID1715]NNM76402.1 DsbC family protein [Sphingomonas sp. ID1715]
MTPDAIKAPNKPARRWLRPAAELAAVVAISAATGWGVASLAAPTAAPDTATVRAALKLRLPKTPIDAIDCSGLGGLCEVASKQTLFYVDRAAKYLVIGRVYDMEARQDLTAARLLALNPDLLTAGAARREAGEDEPPQQRPSVPTRVSLAGLPANGAITWGPADGPKVVVFSDFNCSYCKKLEGELKAIGARVEERPISIFGAESRQVAEQVLCSPRPEMSLRMAYSGLALANPKPCDTSGLDANEAFAKAHGFGGTPVIVRPSDGAVLEGYRPAAALREFLGAAPRQTSKG